MTDNEIKEYISEIRKKADLFRESGYATSGISNHFDKSADVIEELLQYRAIGTVEECQQAMDRMKPKMVIRYGMTTHECPKCGQFLHDDQNFCQDCCTQLDWSEEKHNKAKI